MYILVLKGKITYEQRDWLLEQTEKDEGIRISVYAAFMAYNMDRNEAELLDTLHTITRSYSDIAAWGLESLALQGANE